jgi:hypothetical protein
VKAVGAGNESGIFVPKGWYGGFQKTDSQQMVKEYIAKYGGTPSDVNADVAEAYSVGQVIAGRGGEPQSRQLEDHYLVVVLLLPRGVIPTISQLVKDRRARGRSRAETALDSALGGGVARAAR